MEDGEIMYAPAHLQRDADLKDSAIGCIRDNADMEGNSTIASAVVIPEHDADPSTSPSERLKRRQAEEPGTEALKRQRLSDVGAGAGAESETRENRRQKRMEEEKKRGKRLFGALLGTIGQFQKETTTRGARAAQVKRREVEAKLHEKMKAQTEEIDERRKREDDVVNLRRRVESRDFEERAMHIRHANLLAQANVLATTRTTPKLFYLPWKLSPSDEEVIRSQIEAAEETIRNQEDTFRRLREQDEIDMQAAGGLDTVADTTDPTIDQPDISIHTPPPQDDIADVLDNGELGAQTDEHGEGADSNPVAGHAERRNSDIGDQVDIIDEGGEDAVIY